MIKTGKVKRLLKNTRKYHESITNNNNTRKCEEKNLSIVNIEDSSFLLKTRG